MMDRREFVATAAVVAAGVAGGSKRAACAAGAGGTRKIERIGLQLYTVRSEMEKSVERTLERVAAIGYREVEFAGYFDRSPEQIRKALAAVGLAAPSSHVSWDALDRGWDAVLDAATRAGHGTVVVAWLPPERRGTLDEYRGWAERFNRAAEAARAAGLGFAYHNHDFEFAPTEGRLPYDVLLEQTDPALVGFELDLYWIAKAGQDAQTYFTRAPGRFPLVHVKDMAADGRMADVGAGGLDFAALFARAGDAIRHYFVEHDQPADPFASIRASYEHLKELEF